MPTTKPAAKKATVTKKKVAAKPAAKSVKAPAKKKGILHKLFRSQKGIIKAQKFSRTQYLLTAAVLGTIGIAGVVASHGSTGAEMPTAADYRCTSFTNLSMGSRGACVSYAQALLNYRGAHLKVDGQYGGDTKSAVQAYQINNGLTVKGKADGVIGTNTWSRLRRVATTVVKVTPKVAAKITPKPTPTPKVTPKPTPKPTVSNFAYFTALYQENSSNPSVYGCKVGSVVYLRFFAIGDATYRYGLNGNNNNSGTMSLSSSSYQYRTITPGKSKVTAYIIFKYGTRSTRYSPNYGDALTLSQFNNCY